MVRAPSPQRLDPANPGDRLRSSRESHEEDSIESSPVVLDPQKEFSDNIESLWWSSNFDEAIRTISDNEELPDDFLQKQLALTHAYQCLASKQNLTDTASIENMLAQIQKLEPDSFDSLRELIALTQAIPEETAKSNGKLDDSGEFEFMLGKIPIEDFFYDLQQKKERKKTRSENVSDIIFNELQKAWEWSTED